MPEMIIRERIFNTICFTAGRAGRTLGCKVNQPYVIIGTGRSGTNLLEDILKTHPQITGFPGEANELWHPKLEPFESSQLDIPPIEENPKHFSEISLAQWPHRQKQKIRDVFAGFHLITGSSKTLFTKSAMISFLIPTILDVFPNAKFIHVYRYGLSVVESYFKKNFGKYSKFKYDEAEYRRHCAHYWNDCLIEIEKRKRELSLEESGKFFEFSYESLCENPREVIQGLATFIEIHPDGFNYDFSRITSQNYKVAGFIDTPEGQELIEIMSAGMNIKGYTPDGQFI
jgi:LPS sulfotransferase NodH